jgi:purine-binding chemotaxis protein CheW
MLYSTFQLGTASIGVPIHTVLEIVRSSTFHHIRGAPEVIDGLINLRGKVVTVINTGLAFGSHKVMPSDESRIYIFKSISELKEVGDHDIDMEFPPDNIGLHVDRISNVINVEKHELQPVPQNMIHPFYQHVVRKGDEFIIVLRPSRILTLNKN